MSDVSDMIDMSDVSDVSDMSVHDMMLRPIWGCMPCMALNAMRVLRFAWKCTGAAWL